MIFRHFRTHRSANLSTSPTAELPLSQLPPGTAGTVAAVSGGHQLVSRLACLGFTPGVEIILLQNFGHGPLIVRVRETRLALGRGEAEKILVHPVDL